ncbi:MAG: thiol reductant ABC exporter subunit CydD [Nocardioidaceae bacterium]
MKPTDPAVRRHLEPARGPLTGVLVGSGVTALLVIGQAFAIASFVVAAVRGGDITRWAVATAAVLALRGLVSLIVDRLAARAAVQVGQQLRGQAVDAALRGHTAATGELTALLTRGVTAAEPYLTRYLPAYFLAMVLPLLTVVAITTQDLMSALIVLVTLPLVPVFGALVGLATRDQATKQWRELASLARHFVDVTKGLPTLVSFGRAEAQSGMIRAITDRYRRATVRTLRIGFASSAVLELVATISVALVAVTVGVRLAGGHLDLRTALVVLLLAPEAYWPLRRVGQEFHASAEGLATFEQVAALVDSSEETAAVVPVPMGDLTLRDVEVTYPGRLQPALAPTTATIPDRGITAIVGPSGAGKSTLLAAVLGLAPHTGAVRVGGALVTGAQMRPLVSWVPQRPVFVAGSVTDNLRLAAPEATDEQILAVLRQLRLDIDPATDPARLSAGQRARIALARVLLADRPFVFLDEPTAHLDADTGQVIAETLVELSRDRAVVVVAHSDLLVSLADQVLAIEPATSVPAQPVASGERAAAPVAGPAVGQPVARSRFLLPTLLAAGANLSGVALTATAGWLIVRASEQPPVLALLVAIVGVRTFGIARPVLRYIERLLGHDAALRQLADRRVEVYDTLVPLTPGALGRRPGEVLTAIVDDVESTSDRQLRMLMPLRAGLVTVAVVVLGVAPVLPAAAAVLGLAAAVIVVSSLVIARRPAARAEPEALAARARISALVEDAVQARDELGTWRATGPAVDQIVAEGARLGAASMHTARGIATARAVALVVTGLCVAAVGAVASGPVPSPVSGPVFTLLVLTPLALLDVLLPLADIGAVSARTAAAGQRLGAFEQLRPLVADPSAARPLPESADLRLDHVDAGWGNVPVLRDLSLTLPEGGRVTVTGPSGSGKSTLAALLVRFLDPSRGSVRVGDTDLAALRLRDTRATVGLVDDDPYVFSSTLAANLRLARTDATDADLEAALGRAGLGAWRAALPLGLETMLGDGYATVSGGERARLGVARCLLADSPVWVLDEPTAHLDHATARTVTDQVLAAGERRTIVWITHDEATDGGLARSLTLPGSLGTRGTMREVLPEGAT